MIETKVIHNEVKDLLLEVRNQADKYNYYFTFLEDLKNQADNELVRISQLLDNQESQFNDLLLQLRNENKTLSIELESKILDLSQFELKRTQLNEYLVKFDEKLNKDAEADRSLKTEVQEYIETISSSVKEENSKLKSNLISEIELESRSLESKIYDRIRKIDRHLDQYDKRIYESNSIQEETNKKIFKQLRLVEGIVESVKDITESLSRTMNSDLRNTESHILEKIDILEERQERIKQIEFLDDIVNIDNSISEYKNKYYREVENQNIVLDKYESKIINLTRENQTMSSELIALKNKTNIAVVTSVVSLLLMLVLAVML